MPHEFFAVQVCPYFGFVDRSTEGAVVTLQVPFASVIPVVNPPQAFDGDLHVVHIESEGCVAEHVPLQSFVPLFVLPQLFAVEVQDCPNPNLSAG